MDRRRTAGTSAVRDTGVGIAPEHIPRLTERFYRVDSGRSRDLGGSGLGLAIVRHALQRHDGTLTIESVEGRGSTFTCHFPAQRVVPQPAEFLQAKSVGLKPRALAPICTSCPFTQPSHRDSQSVPALQSLCNKSSV